MSRPRGRAARVYCGRWGLAIAAPAAAHATNKLHGGTAYATHTCNILRDQRARLGCLYHAPVVWGLEMNAIRRVQSQEPNVPLGYGVG